VAGQRGSLECGAGAPISNRGAREDHMATRQSLRCAAGLAALVVTGMGAADAAQRTFVSTVGSDASAACSLAAPCRGFAKAITLTDPNGEIVVLDSGGYGSVTIAKSVTITSPAGVYAGVSVFAGQDGIVVGPGAAKVVLRGLTINGQGGNNGVLVQTGAGDVHVENVVIANLAAGIKVEGGTSVRLSHVVSRTNLWGMLVQTLQETTAVTVRDSEFSSNGVAGVEVAPAPLSVAMVTVENSTATRNGAGYRSGGGGTSKVVITHSVASDNTQEGVSANEGGATVYVRETAATRNGTGLQQQSSGVLNACGSNLLVANGAAQSGTVNVNAAACLDQVAGGTVTNVATAAGLTGGPITTTGTIGLAATNLLPTTACAANQVPQWNGSAWICAAAGGTGTVTNVGTGTGLTGGPVTTSGTIAADTTYLQRRVSGTCAAGSSVRTINADGTVVCETDDVGAGTVTSVATGAGLTGGPISGSGTVSVANAGITAAMLAGNGCASGQLLKWNGSAWACANDVDTSSGGTVTSITAGGGLTGGTITGSGTIAVDPASSTLTGNFFRQGGNAFGAVARLGTTDNNALELAVNGARVMRYEPNANAPNVIGGDPNNSVGAFYGQTVAGGGQVGSTCYDPPSGEYTRSCGNQVNGVFSTIGGGYANLASNAYATVGGGRGNTASNYAATAGAGMENIASGGWATVAGGQRNTASGPFTVVAGGSANIATGDYAVVAGGMLNVVSGSASFIGGGQSNAASGFAGTVPGGYGNLAAGAYSFAAGRRAKAAVQGCFAWADSTDADFACSVVNGFFVRSAGGVRIFGPGNWDVQNTEGDLRIGNDDYRLKFGIALDGGGIGDAWVRAHGGIERFNIWAPGGTRVLTNAAGTTGVTIAAGAGSWSTLSDRNAKRDFEVVDTRDVLDRVAAMPVYRWRYAEERSAASHMGPVAQDFRAAFGLGDGDRTIATVDADGVALAAIQGLNAKIDAQAAALVERDARIERQARAIDAQRAELADLRQRVAQFDGVRDELAAMRNMLSAALATRTGATVASR
jgi:trimeric autotransporter adhesin